MPILNPIVTAEEARIASYLLEMAADAFEKGTPERRSLTRGRSLAAAFAITGEEYVEFLGCGSTALEAVSAWLKGVQEYKDGKPDGSILYWRIEPEIDCFVDFREGKYIWKVYSRLLLSDKPEREVGPIFTGNA